MLEQKHGIINSENEVNPYCCIEKDLFSLRLYKITSVELVFEESYLDEVL
jgi:hypothetical protein